MAKENKRMEKERSFSVELKSKVNLSNITLNNGSQENALIEGTIGELEHAEFVEGGVLEVLGGKGVLRIDLCESEVKRKGKEVNGRSNETHKEVN